jgi:hypothetical protein
MTAVTGDRKKCDSGVMSSNTGPVTLFRRDNSRRKNILAPLHAKILFTGRLPLNVSSPSRENTFHRRTLSPLLPLSSLSPQLPLSPLHHCCDGMTIQRFNISNQQIRKTATERSTPGVKTCVLFC